MKKTVVTLMLGLTVSGFALAGTQSADEVRHIVPLNGLAKGEGRYIRVDIRENDQYNTGYYFCATKHTPVYQSYVYAEEVPALYNMTTSIKFSICQDESLAQCQEFATDQFNVFKNIDGELETDSRSIVPVSIADIKDQFKPCTPHPDALGLVKNLMTSRKNAL